MSRFRRVALKEHLLSAGDVQGGYSFYVQDGKLHYVYNYVGSEFYHV